MPLSLLEVGSQLGMICLICVCLVEFQGSQMLLYSMLLSCARINEERMKLCCLGALFCAQS